MVVLVVAVCVSACGAGGPRPSPMSQLQSALERRIGAYGDLSPYRWVTVIVRDVRLGELRLPRGHRRVVRAGGVADVSVRVSTAAAVKIAQQRLIEPGGAVVSTPVRVTAVISRERLRVWRVDRVLDVTYPRMARLLTTAAARAVVGDAIRTLFAFGGNRYAFAVAQRPFYATTPGPGFLGPPTLSSATGAVFGEGCALAIQTTPSVLPDGMRPRAVNVTNATWLTSVPPTIAVDGRAAVQVTGWHGKVPSLASIMGVPGLSAGSGTTVLSNGVTGQQVQVGGNQAVICRPATATLSFRAVVIRSYTSHRWLIGQIDTWPGSHAGDSASAHRAYFGLEAW